MTENQIRQQLVEMALSYKGVREGSAEHKKIIEIYNSFEPHPRGHVLTVTEPWCAGFVSAMAIACGLTDIIPVECSCSELIKLAKKMGCWAERDDYVPKPADIVLYDWQDDGKGDNTGAPDHTGIVEKTTDGVIYAIEGNYNNAVGIRQIPVNGKYIRGFITPNYASKATKEPSTYTLTLNYLRKGDKGPQVESLQRLLLAYGYKMTAGNKTYGVDGDFGAATENAVLEAQREHGWQADGEVGPETMGGLLGL